jgi:hypothetical protein
MKLPGTIFAALRYLQKDEILGKVFAGRFSYLFFLLDYLELRV